MFDIVRMKDMDHDFGGPVYKMKRRFGKSQKEDFRPRRKSSTHSWYHSKTQKIMKQNYKAEYTPSDYEMSQFKAMEGKYATENEKRFFETMLRKIRTQYTDVNETIISYEDNKDEIYLYREGYDDFEVGRYSKEVSDSPVFTNGLFSILSVNLGENLLSEHITLLDWLRKDDFKCVQYDNWE